MELIDLVPNSLSFRVFVTLDVREGDEVPAGFSGRVRVHDGEPDRVVAVAPGGDMHDLGGPVSSDVSVEDAAGRRALVIGSRTDLQSQCRRSGIHINFALGDQRLGRPARADASIGEEFLQADRLGIRHGPAWVRRSGRCYPKISSAEIYQV